MSATKENLERQLKDAENMASLGGILAGSFDVLLGAGIAYNLIAPKSPAAYFMGNFGLIFTIYLGIPMFSVILSSSVYQAYKAKKGLAQYKSLNELQ